MNIIKKNKFTMFIIVFFLIMFVLILQLKGLFFPDSGVVNYGDRLDGLTEIKKDEKDSCIKALKENDGVSKVDIDIKGRIINIIITLDDSVTQTNARSIAEKCKDNLSKTTLSNYDIQVFLNKTNEKENDFPIIGYKRKGEDTFNYTKSRTKTEVE